ncbi:DUF3127 domain-containing protein [Faecalibacter rhinopitheci]|uniref:DUF3127 domain-containing protein n=1 Tax=Faecalibacter rhinopitheci TaxID=2779678 RepID=A0A8J7FQ88_9FLAO|nr:DUF3127 domain-containing protein [Faecalibacter rhinopitheci]MBF0597614.1 DUF3127 domain-containing protein [Faecalibacter rhinopitheci]MBQ0148596.1 DUF3127 domain-containing protein [Candidatus Onthonaster equi]
MEITGRIKKIFETQNVTASFKKRELVVTTQEQYPQDILIEFTQDKTDVLNAYKEGAEVKVSINIRGREWINPEGVAKYFNSIQGWRIEALTPEQPTENGGGYQDFAPAPPVDTFGSSDDDDLPF